MPDTVSVPLDPVLVGDVDRVTDGEAEVVGGVVVHHDAVAVDADPS